MSSVPNPRAWSSIWRSLSERRGIQIASLRSGQRGLTSMSSLIVTSTTSDAPRLVRHEVILPLLRSCLGLKSDLQRLKFIHRHITHYKPAEVVEQIILAGLAECQPVDSEAAL